VQCRAFGEERAHLARNEGGEQAPWRAGVDAMGMLHGEGWSEQEVRTVVAMRQHHLPISLSDSLKKGYARESTTYTNNGKGITAWAKPPAPSPAAEARVRNPCAHPGLLKQQNPHLEGVQGTHDAHDLIHAQRRHVQADIEDLACAGTEGGQGHQLSEGQVRGKLSAWKESGVLPVNAQEQLGLWRPQALA